MIFLAGKQNTTLSTVFSPSNIFLRRNLPLLRACVLSFSILISFSSCTGINLRSWPLAFAPNTHPSETYAYGGVLLKGGVFYHMDSTILYSGSGKLEKTGRACSYSILYLVAFGSSRIYDAKVNGGVRSIGIIEEEILAILGGAFHRHCTIVVGDAK